MGPGIKQPHCSILTIATMAEPKSTVTVVPLNGGNYPTYACKVQCRMALMKDELWTIVDGTERAPDTSDAQKYEKYVAQRDRALAIIVLSVEPSLLYLIGDTEDPVAVWKKLANHFQKKTWAAKLELRHKLHSLRLQEGDSVQAHVKALTEIFDGLAAAGDAVSEEDRAVHLLASLPDCFGVLVTALEANPNVPKMEVVIECLLHEERKLRERTDDSDKAMNAEHQRRKKGPKCHFCHRFGHIKRNCDKFAKAAKGSSHRAIKVEMKWRDSSSSDSESAGLLVSHALSASVEGRHDSWIVDSGATGHVCNNVMLFVELPSLKEPLDVALGEAARWVDKDMQVT